MLEENMGLKMSEKNSVTKETAVKYRLARKGEKTVILNGFTELTGFHRKYAIKVLKTAAQACITEIYGRTIIRKVKRKKRAKRVYPKYYDAPVQAMLTRVWEAFNRQCGKLLAPFMRVNLDTIASHRLFIMTDEVKMKLKKISSATIDRILKVPKQKLQIYGTCGTKSTNRYKTLIPILTHFECSDKAPGFFQIDLVQHDGGDPSGEFCYTLTITDVATGWTVHYSLKNKAQKWIKESLEHLRTTSPFPFYAIHSDSGSEFLNATVFNWAKLNNIEFSKGRIGKKNDNCYVEQKNKASVRDIVGRCRYSGDKCTAALQAVYNAYDMLLNLYYPCMKLVSKVRVGSKYKKRYDIARPPYQRLLERKDVPLETKQALIELKTATGLMEHKLLMDEAIDTMVKSTVLYSRNIS
jgi:transposase InsO family protein